MTGKQQGIGFHQRHKAGKYLALRRLVKIDHHITAKNHVELARQGPAVGQQVEWLEGDHLAQFGAHPDLPFAIAYGSSPVELAEHQMVIGPLNFLTCSASSGK